MDDLANLIVKKLVKGGYVAKKRSGMVKQVGNEFDREVCWETKPRKSKIKCGDKRKKSVMPPALAPYATARSALKGITLQKPIREALVKLFAENYDHDISPKQNKAAFKIMLKEYSPFELLRDHSA